MISTTCTQSIFNSDGTVISDDPLVLWRMMFPHGELDGVINPCSRSVIVVKSPNIDPLTGFISTALSTIESVIDCESLDCFKYSGSDYYSLGKGGLVKTGNSVYPASRKKLIPSMLRPELDKYDSVDQYRDMLVCKYGGNSDLYVMGQGLQLIASLNFTVVGEVRSIAGTFYCLSNKYLYAIRRDGVRRLYEFDYGVSSYSFLQNHNNLLAVNSDSDKTNLYYISDTGSVSRLDIGNRVLDFAAYGSQSKFDFADDDLVAYSLISNKSYTGYEVELRPLDIISQDGSSFFLKTLMIYTKGLGSLVIEITESKQVLFSQTIEIVSAMQRLEIPVNCPLERGTLKITASQLSSLSSKYNNNEIIISDIMVRGEFSNEIQEVGSYDAPLELIGSFDDGYIIDYGLTGNFVDGVLLAEGLTGQFIEGSTIKVSGEFVDGLQVVLSGEFLDGTNTTSIDMQDPNYVAIEAVVRARQYDVIGDTVTVKTQVNDTLEF